MEKIENSTMIEKFVKYIMLDGKKSIAKKILNNTFEEIMSK
jgi:ribosomal protein S7